MSDRRHLLANASPIVIAGSGGGGKSGGSGTEQPDNLKSTQVAKIIDLISEGPTRGLIDGMKSAIVDGTRLRNENGTMNHQKVILQEVNGWPNQQIMQGFATQQNEQAVQTQLMYNVPQVRTILNPDVDRCRVTVSVPSLQQIDKKKGDIKGTSVKFRVRVQYDGGGYINVGDYTISGKTTSRYQRAILFPLKKGPAPFDIQVTRLTADSKTNDLQNDLYWDSYTEIIDDRVNYNLSACIGVQVSAEQFNSIPKRVYEYDGLIVQIPENYDPDKATYDGVWSGDFKYDWTNNPAWVLYDLLTNGRYGLGQYVSPSMVDKWSFYKVAQWCDQLVPNGRGGTERRWVCNCQIFTQQEAYDLLQQFAGIFRGFTYWNGSQMVAIADQPSDPVVQFTNANVVNGSFQYSGSDIRSRHTQINVGWNDPALLGQPRYAVVEDQEAISKYGIQPLDLPGLGCTSESQAIRLGKWQLYTELYEAEAVQFQTGLETAWVRPGDIVRIMDANISGNRWGGRIGSTSTASIIQFDAPVSLTGGVTYTLYCVIGEGVPEGRSFSVAVSGDFTSVTLSTPFSQAPAPGTVWVVQDPGDLEATLWRVISVRQSEADRYEVNGVRHYPDKWEYVERGIALSEPTISDIPTIFDAVEDIKLIEYLRPISDVSVAVFATVSWISSAPRFQVSWRRSGTDENWQTINTELTAVDLQVTEGVWEFQIIPISPIGIKGKSYTFKREIIGKFALPEAPRNFRVSIIDGVASFSWDPASDVDVVIGGRFELRHTINQTNGTWAGAQKVVASIPGRATSVETAYRTGTWMLRTFDITGRQSAGVAMIIAAEPDGRFSNFFRIEESPDYLGSRSNTEVLFPQEWLIIGATGGYWDSQLDDIDDWADVDVLPIPPDEEEPPPFGSYKFDNRIDMGDVFAVSFSSDVLAFPFNPNGPTIDDRAQNVDIWPDWDDDAGELTGSATIMVRHTADDPSLSSADWSPWSPLTTGEYVNRGFEFRADLSAPLGQNIGVERLAITADVRNKIDAGEDLPYPAATTRIYFATKFYVTPAVVVTVQNAASSDVVQIVAKTREYFDIEIKNGSGVHQTRTFDFHSQGY